MSSMLRQANHGPPETPRGSQLHKTTLVPATLASTILLQRSPLSSTILLQRYHFPWNTRNLHQISKYWCLIRTPHQFYSGCWHMNHSYIFCPQTKPNNEVMAKFHNITLWSLSLWLQMGHILLPHHLYNPLPQWRFSFERTEPKLHNPGSVHNACRKRMPNVFWSGFEIFSPCKSD
jgi:hypothetical protein